MHHNFNSSFFFIPSPTKLRRDIVTCPSVRTLLIFKVKGQGHRVKFLGKGIRHALRCPCLQIFNKMLIKIEKITEQKTLKK